MAIDSLYTALMGGGSDPNDYLAKDPYYIGGLSLLKQQYQPRTNAEALLVPLLQGLAGGGLMGFGRGRAEESQYDTIRQSPAMADTLASMKLEQALGPVASGDAYGAILESPISKAKFPVATDYLSPNRPSGWTPELGQADVANAVINKQRTDQLSSNLIERLLSEDPEAGIEAAKNLYGIDFGALPPIVDTSKDLRRQQMAEIQQRFEDAKAIKEAQVEFPGYEYAGKTRPTPAEAAKVREEIGKNEKLKYAIQALGDSVDKKGFMKIFGNDAQLQGALYSFIFNTSRQAYDFGARLEGPEANLLKAMTPSVAAGDFAGAIKTALTGRSPSQLAKDLVKIIDKSQDALMAARFEAVRQERKEPLASSRTSARPPPPLPGESLEAYKARVRG